MEENASTVMDQPILRGQLTITQLDLLLYLWQCPRSDADIAGFLGIQQRGIPVYMYDMRRIGLSDKEGRLWTIGVRGEQLLRQIGGIIRRI